MRSAILCLVCVGCFGCGSRAAWLVDGGQDQGPREDRLTPDRGREDAARISFVEHAKRACTVAASCAPPLQVKGTALSASSCLDAFGRLDWPEGGYTFAPSSALAQRLLDCVPATGKVDCKSFIACYGGSWVGFSACREYAGCEGSKLVGYKPGELYFDCAALAPGAGSCVDLPTGMPRACCSGSTCTSSGTVCQGSKGTSCTLGIHWEFDCASTGRICSSDPTLGSCQGTGASCTAGSPPTCKAATATYCAGGKLATTDCATRPLRSACDPSSSYLPCRPSGSECSPEFEGTCSGAMVMVCVDGRREPVDCSSLGFEICHGASADGRSARCGFLL